MNVKKLWTLILLFLLMTGCEKLKTMKQEVVNIINLNEMELIEKKSSKVPANFFYGNDLLYIADRKNQRILVLDEENKPYIEIGTLKQKVASPNQKFWEKELQGLMSELKEDEKIEPRKKKRTTPRQRIRKKYEFEKLGQITADFQENIYTVDHTSKGTAIIKFSRNGKFLYRIGEDGRDNPYFRGKIKILGLYVSKNNGLWVKYIDQDTLKLSYYNSYGKGIYYFEESKIENSIKPHIQKQANEHYQIEDIFPLMEQNQVAVAVNLYKKKAGRYMVNRKMFLEINRHYGVENYWEFDDKHLQVFNVNIDEKVMGFSYFTKEKTPLLKVFDSSGKSLLKKKISLQRFNYKRVDVSLTQTGNLMGVFLKKNILYFVLWK